MNDNEFDLDKLLEAAKEMVGDTEQSKYHCEIKTVEIIANGIDNDVRNVLKSIDQSKYVTAQVIMQYLYGNVKALEIIINELKDGTKEIVK